MRIAVPVLSDRAWPSADADCDRRCRVTAGLLVPSIRCSRRGPVVDLIRWWRFCGLSGPDRGNFTTTGRRSVLMSGISVKTLRRTAP